MQIAAKFYIVIVFGVIFFQCCLIAGAPWGRLTQGGRFEGVLPVSARIAAALSIPLLLAMGAGISSAAGMIPHWPEWTAYALLFVQALSVFLNWITPSKPERLLWGPITLVMLALAIFVIFSV